VDDCKSLSSGSPYSNGKYQPPNRRDGSGGGEGGGGGPGPGSPVSSLTFGSPPLSPSSFGSNNQLLSSPGARNFRSKSFPSGAQKNSPGGGGGGQQRQMPVKKNPAPGFTGAGFRSVRENYCLKVGTRQ